MDNERRRTYASTRQVRYAPIPLCIASIMPEVHLDRLSTRGVSFHACTLPSRPQAMLQNIREPGPRIRASHAQTSHRAPRAGAG